MRIPNTLERRGVAFATRVMRSAILASVVGAAGCAAQTPLITVPSTEPVVAVPNEATIVVVQPTTHFGWVNLLAGDGKLLGQIHDRSQTVVRLPPGHFRLYAIPELLGQAGDRIDGDLLAGRIYYATIGGRAAGLKLLALKPGSLDHRWEQRENYLMRPMLRMDPSRTAEVTRKLGDTRVLFKQVEEFSGRLTGAYREERILRPEDGL